jgi:hypothetical protein
VTLFLPGRFPEVSLGDPNESSSTDMYERIMEQLLINSKTSEDINLDRGLMDDILAVAIEDPDEAPELLDEPINSMSTIAPDEREKPPPAALKAPLSVEE